MSENERQMPEIETQAACENYLLYFAINQRTYATDLI